MRFRLKLAVMAAVAAGLVYLGAVSAAEVKDVKGCMAFQNKVRGDIGKQAKAGKWEDVQKQTDEWVKVAETIGSLKPPMGDEKSWKDQTAKYLTNVKAVDAAADKKDADGVAKGLATIQASCGGCHGKHKPKK
jgi:cytochrome c556